MGFLPPRRRFAPLVPVGVTAFAVIASCELPRSAPDGRDFGELRMQFVYQGSEVAGSLIVSDGRFWQEWRNQSRIAARVPARATYIIDLKPPGDSASQAVTFRDIIPEFRVPAGGVRDVIVNVPDPGEPDAFAPFILVEDREAEARIENVLDVVGPNRERVRITSTIVSAPGAQVLVDGLYMQGDERPETARDYTCGANCPHVFSGVDCSEYCYTCTSTAYYEGYWKGNYNMCEGLTATPPRSSEFDVLPDGLGGVHLAAATENDAIVYPQQSELSRGETRQTLAPPFTSRSFPDFVAPTGIHRYEVTFPGRDRRQRFSLALPVPVSDGRITQLHLSLPAGPLEPLVPMLVGDTRLGVPDRVLGRALSEGEVTISVRTTDPDPGHAWVLLPLPDGSSMESVTNASTGAPLAPEEDFIVSRLGGVPVLVLRTEGGESRLTVRY